ncbi:MAG: hypothetical protein HY390_02685 [Deltaproteobacteria bacterium]|nr:hypothetical protein [Deltaproteobacteria bacterium]
MKRIFVLSIIILFLFLNNGTVFATISEVDHLKLNVSYLKKNTNDPEKIALNIPVMPSSVFYFVANNLKVEVIYNRLDDGKSTPKTAELQFKIFKGVNLISSPKMKILVDQQASMEVGGKDTKLNISTLFHSE